MKNLKITVPLVIITLIVIISVGTFLVYAIVIANQPIESTSGSVTTGTEQISWDEAGALIESCNVQSVMQAHDLSVDLTLLDGQRKLTKEPEIDAVLNKVAGIRNKCDVKPSMASE